MVLCKIPINTITSAVPAMIFPPYKKFPGLVSAVKQAFKAPESQPSDAEHTDNSQNDKKLD